MTIRFLSKLMLISFTIWVWPGDLKIRTKLLTYQGYTHGRLLVIALTSDTKVLPEDSVGSHPCHTKNFHFYVEAFTAVLAKARMQQTHKVQANNRFLDQ